MSPEPALLVDVGTNGEIVLAANGSLLATSVAAGPAFEGARIVHGMRGATGAIENVIADNDIRLSVVGNVPPIGICGSGLVDLMATLLDLGIVEPSGRILGPDEIPPRVPPAIRRRVTSIENQHSFVLAFPDESGTGQAIRLHQRDIRELQLANGAIRAGITVLLKMQGIRAENLRHIMLAGAFGNFIRPASAQRIGMLPSVPRDRILFAGNTASLGARRALLSVSERKRADIVARMTRHVDLSRNPEFQDEFASAMIFPESDR
ncbi:MAG: ATP-binding protein [Kiritimatiellae bacterium]|nr:ATP-binding protein [Kiritimatiellia bacterium]